MAIAIGELGVANTSTIARRRPGPRLDVVRPHPGARRAARRMPSSRLPLRGCGSRCGSCTTTRSPTATCAARRSPSTTARPVRRLRQRRVRRDRRPAAIRHRPAAGDDDAALRRAVGGARGDRGVRQGRRADRVTAAHEIRCAANVSGSPCSDAKAVITAARDEVKHQTGADEIQTETITRFTRNQVIQLVLLVALVYVAYPFISTVPTFFSELRTANWWWALLGLAVSALTYVGAAAALWACADGLVSLRDLIDHAGGQHVRRHHHPRGRRRAGAERPVPAEGRARRAARHHRGRAAAVGAGDHARRAADLLQRRRGRFGQPVAVRAEAPRCCTWSAGVRSG